MDRKSLDEVIATVFAEHFTRKPERPNEPKALDDRSRERLEAIREEEFDAFKKDLDDAVGETKTRQSGRFVYFRFLAMFRRSIAAKGFDGISNSLAFRMFAKLNEEFPDAVPYAAVAFESMNTVDNISFEGAVVRAADFPLIARRIGKFKRGREAFGNKMAREHWALRRLLSPSLTGKYYKYEVDGEMNRDRSAFVRALEKVRRESGIRAIAEADLKDAKAYELLKGHALVVTEPELMTPEESKTLEKRLAKSLANYLCMQIRKEDVRASTVEEIVAEAGIFPIRRYARTRQILFAAASERAPAFDTFECAPFAIQCARRGTLAALASTESPEDDYVVSRGLYRKKSKHNPYIDIVEAFKARESHGRNATPIVIAIDRSRRGYGTGEGSGGNESGGDRQTRRRTAGGTANPGAPVETPDAESGIEMDTTNA